MEQQRNPQSQGSETRKCYACNKFGHLASRCPTRRHNANALGEDLQEPSSLDELFAAEEPEKDLIDFGQENPAQVGRMFCDLSSISTSTSSMAIHAYLNVGGHQFKMLIDTGTSISLLSEETLQILGRQVDRKDALPVVTANRTLLEIQGMVQNIPIQVADLTFPATLQVMTKTSYPVILG